MWVKICGTTNLDDARAAVDAGADALGFIFAPSSRRISPRDAARIIGGLPREVQKVGVFVNQSADIILETVNKAGLTAAQLQGDEDLAYVRELRRRAPKLPLIKTVPMRELSEARRAAIWETGAEDVLDTVLLDSGTPARRGGTGVTFDWDEAAPLVRLLARKFKLIVAGGLTPHNVTDAINAFHPWGVDVVSGVEREPGHKDHDKLRAFVAAAKSAIAAQERPA